jgi:type II secretory pathway pseudopilin PulG
MIEIMVSVALVGIATAFVFSIQIRMSSALRDQQTVSETQQTLRSATELMLRDLRTSGFLASQIAVVPAPATPWTQNPIGPVTVVNGGVDGAPDQLLVVSADTSAVTVVNSGTPLVGVANAMTNFTDSTGSNVVSSAGFAPGFAPGNPVLFTYALPNVSTADAGKGCILGVTGTAPTVIVTDPAGGAPWNDPGNAHCVAGIPNFQSTLYTSGLTEVTKVVLRAYRIRPGDGRGVLEMSPSGGRVNGDYQPLALGIVDMQIALRIATPNPTAVPPGTVLAPCALDGDAHHDWYSSDNMNSPMIPADARVVGVSITLLAKTTKEVQGVTIAQTPDLFEGDVGHRACNHTGDVAGKPLPVTSPTTSPYFGEHAYRNYTATVDLRNVNANGNLAN